MTQREALAALQGAYSLIGQVIDSLTEPDECAHPSETLEPLPVTMGSALRPMRCTGCGETLQISWEEKEDG